MLDSFKSFGIAALLVLFGLGLWWGLRSGEARDSGAVERAAALESTRAERAGAIDAPRQLQADVTPEQAPVESEREEVVVVPDTASLLVEFVDQVTGEPVSGMIQLWRIGLPEDDVWTAGDQLIERLTIELGQHEFAELVPGSYRIEAGMARLGHGALDEFAVDPGANVMRFEVDAARRRLVQVAVVDQDGRPWAQKVEFMWMRSKGDTRFFSDPDWVHLRRKKDENWSIGIGGGSGGHYRSARRDWQKHPMGTLGYEVGEREPSSVAKSYLHLWKLRLERSTPQPIPFGADAELEAAITGWTEVERKQGPDSGAWPGEQRFVVDFEIDDIGGPAFVVVAVDPYLLVERLEGVADYELADLLAGLRVMCSAAPIESVNELLGAAQVDVSDHSTGASITVSSQAASVLIELNLDGKQRLKTRWFPTAEPLPRLIVAPKELDQ